jgi:hypothetical protein
VRSASRPERVHPGGVLHRVAVVWPAAAVLALTLVSTTSWTQGGVRNFENDGGGYSFTYPSSWEVTAGGAVSKLRSPSGTVVISFGPGSTGSLRNQSDRSSGLIERTYEQVRFEEPLRLTIGTSPALEISGTATNDAGVRVSFRAITVRAPERTYAIVAFAAVDAPDGEASAIDGIVSSFEPPIEAAEPNARREAPADGARGAVRQALEEGSPSALLIAIALGALLLIAALWIARPRLAAAHSAPDDQHEYVRVHLRDGRWIEGWRKGQSLNRVIILDPVAVCDREGLSESPDPEDSFIPESSVIRIEPRAQKRART